MIKKQIHTLLKGTSLFLLLITPWIISAQVPNYVPTNGLVGWWPFNGNAIDESINNNDGTVNGATLTSDRNGVANSAFNFDGINQKIIIPDNNNLSFPNATFTTSYWVNIQTPITNGSAILCKYGITNDFEYGNFIYSSSSVSFSTYNLNGTCGVNGSGLSNSTQYQNNWHYFTSVHNGYNGSGLYVDGVLISSSNSSTASCSMGNGSGNLYFGMGGGWNQQLYFKGLLDDIGIWNRVLTLCEIQDLYNAQLNSLAVNAGIDQTVCAGTSVTLSGTGADTYSWNNSVSNGVGFNPTVSNEYVVTVADVNGCLGTDTVNVTVNNPSSSTLTEIALDSYTLNGQTYTQSGIYTQLIPNAAGCDSTITLNLSLSFTGLNELQTGFTIAPNPTMDFVTITSSELLYDEYVLFDPQGRKVLSGTLTGTTTQLDLSRLARGNYLLQIGEKGTPIKLVKE